MEQPLIDIREQQKASWNKFSSGWRKWDELMMDFLQPVGDEIIRLINAQDNALVLDVAGGSGEPGLTIASRLAGGRVIITDIAEDMLAIAREHAAARGISNIETRVCDVCELPFADNSFDAISCRFGFMFFPDVHLAASEMYRVLKPGGKIATSVWSGPDKNFWITAMGGTINRNMDIPAPPPGAPGMFRCAEKGFMGSLFQNAGFGNITEEEIAVVLKCGTGGTYWDMMTDVAAPFVAALSKADPALRDKIKEEVFQALHQQYPDGKVFIDGVSIVAYGEK